MTRRYFFSLIELLIVMGLIVVVAGAVTWNLIGLKEEQQFQTSVAKLEELFQTAEELMLIYNEEVRVVLSPSENGIIGQIKTHTPFYTKLGEQLKDPLLLTGVKSFSFEEKTDEPISLTFSSIRKSTPKGILSIAAYPTIDTDGPLKARFYFSGYPRVIQANRPIEQIKEEPLPEEIQTVWNQRNEKKT